MRLLVRAEGDQPGILQDKNLRPGFKFIHKTIKIGMMKHLVSVFLAGILICSLWSCGTRDKSQIVKGYQYKEESAKVNEVMQKKIGAWLQEGMTCYGIVILTDGDGLPKKVKEIQAKVISVQKDKIKMKALEDLALAPVKGCTKIGMRKGETWDETEGDLFQTREEAIKFIDTNYPDMQLNNK
jgi:hypothetical protein